MLCNNLDFVPIYTVDEMLYRVDEMLISGLLYEVKKECLKRNHVHL
jgi:hypothetical protein